MYASMYADSDLHLRHPFVHSAAADNQAKPSWPSHWHSSRPSQALTPPPEMNGSAHPANAGYYPQENGLGYGGYGSGIDSYNPPAASYLPQEVSNADFGRATATTKPVTRSLSPSLSQRQSTNDDAQPRSHAKRGSQADIIAPSFQIPKSVNDSGGSLSELAAQITCLFWFESSTLLQQIEDSVIPLHPSRPLASDAKPTSGFRKWVTTLLSTTLVAQNVVVLALLFIYRLKKLNPSVQGRPGSEYRLLTVALMLGNKFLDDNTYTNRTWAEVSGINVTEVHVMEVEFLSNMKYNLFTTADDWTKWQCLLGKFAAFFEKASKPLPPVPPAPILAPTPSPSLPMALPSPPSSNQASPPYLADLGSNGQPYGVPSLSGPSPAPSPHVYMSNNAATRPNLRKRSRDDQAVEPPPKRQASGYPDYQSPHQYSAPQSTQISQGPRLPLPNLAYQPSQGSSSNQMHSNLPLLQQLPPLTVPARAMAMVYPSVSAPSLVPQSHAHAGTSQPPSQIPSQYQSRQHSPYPTSAAASPSSALPSSATSLHPVVQVSPTYFLQHRDSPYRPVHHVSTLLYPPSSTALQHRPQNVESNQMYYQPLGKPQQRQTGRLPYVAQNMWLDGSCPESMTPISQWPSFLNTHHYQQLISQQ